jgi:cytochrome c oxidase cbb3-type subunit 3
MRSTPSVIAAEAGIQQHIAPSVIPAEAGIQMRIAAGVALAAALVLVALVTGCQREERHFQAAPPGATPPGIVRMSSNIPGPPSPVDSSVGPYGNNAYAVSQGQKLFSSFNCAGCHSNGGGGMGPPLMDDEWVYGSEPRNIYESIVEGRPNGMPSWGGRIPDKNIWELVAYVRSLGGLTPSATRSARTDNMMMKPGSQSLMKPSKPKPSSLPPGAITP